MQQKNILVYPCGTEIGLEIYRSIHGNKQYVLYGGSSTYDHGRFTYENHIDGLPFINDKSDKNEIIKFINAISAYHFDYIYPAMDGVLTKFSYFHDLFHEIIIAPRYETCKITRSKLLTYGVLKDVIRVPKVYHVGEDISYPVFIKPDVGQGSNGAMKIDDERQLFDILKYKKDEYVICEMLPGDEYTVDCFTNSVGKLIIALPRARKRIKNGISINTYPIEDDELVDMAYKINEKIHQKGGWFFQVKRDVDNKYTLLEVSSRIAGSSSLARNRGVNMPLLTVNEFNGIITNDVIINNYDIEIDRSLNNVCKIDLKYNHVYIDYDDTIIINNRINTQLISFIIECINSNKHIHIISKHDGDLESDLKKYRIYQLFDSIIHIGINDDKWNFINHKDSIYIDDSYNERKNVYQKLGIPVFDIHNIECLKKERD